MKRRAQVFYCQIWLQQMERRDETDADLVEALQRGKDRRTCIFPRESNDRKKNVFFVGRGNGMLRSYER